MVSEDLAFRVLVLAPIGRDGELLAQTLSEKGILAESVANSHDFLVRFSEGCGAALLTEEALHEDPQSGLRQAVASQPPWSEVPFIVLTSRGQAEERVQLTLELMQPLRNATILERPVRPATVVTALEAALRDRRRQYEVRDALESLQKAKKELEEKVRERTADLMNRVEEMEGFTYSISHDLRSPLRAMISKARIVEEEEGQNLSEDGRQNLGRLTRAAARMAQLVDDLLQYARLGTREMKKEPVNLGRLVKFVAKNVDRDRPEASLSVRIECNAIVLCDPRIIGMALQNLLDNACKYRKDGQPAHVVFGCERRPGELAFFIKDCGIGFDMAYVGKLFTPFERLHREEYTGTGIGLANVRRGIERHGGRIWAEAIPGDGATFWFTLGTGSEVRATTS